MVETTPSSPGCLIVHEDVLTTDLNWPSSVVLIKISIIDDKCKGATCLALQDEPWHCHVTAAPVHLRAGG